MQRPVPDSYSTVLRAPSKQKSLLLFGNTNSNTEDGKPGLTLACIAVYSVHFPLKKNDAHVCFVLLTTHCGPIRQETKRM